MGKKENEMSELVGKKMRWGVGRKKERERGDGGREGTYLSRVPGAERREGGGGGGGGGVVGGEGGRPNENIQSTFLLQPAIREDSPLIITNNCSCQGQLTREKRMRNRPQQCRLIALRFRRRVCDPIVPNSFFLSFPLTIAGLSIKRNFSILQRSAA